MELNLYLNGVEYRFTDKYTIREQVGQPASSSFDIKLEDNPLPLTHTKVELKQNGSNIFLGYIKNVETPTYSTTFETDIVPIQVVSAETVFTRRLVSEVWISTEASPKYTHTIVQDLYDNYLAEEGFTLGTIEEFERLYEKYTVPNLYLSDVFVELGDEIGAVAQITADGVFNFVSKNNFPNVTPPTHITKLKLTESGQDLKTIQKISGAKAETSIQTKSIVWATGQTDLLLGYQLAEEPTVTINSTVVAVGLQGADNDNVNKTFLWKYGNNTLVLNTNATTQPVNGDNVSVIFKGFYNIEINAENEDLKVEIANLSGTSGKIESIVVDTSITDPQDGETTAQNLLSEKAIRERTLTLQCEDIVKSSLLNQWELNYPDLNITGNFVIVERTITDFYDKFRINLKLKNRGFYSRYGTVLNKYNKEINNLSVRTDDLVFKNSSLGDTFTYTEGWEIEPALMAFTPGITDIFSPVYFAGLTPAGY